MPEKWDATTPAYPSSKAWSSASASAYYQGHGSLLHSLWPSQSEAGRWAVGIDCGCNRHCHNRASQTWGRQNVWWRPIGGPDADPIVMEAVPLGIEGQASDNGLQTYPPPHSSILTHTHTYEELITIVPVLLPSWAAPLLKRLKKWDKFNKDIFWYKFVVIGIFYYHLSRPNNTQSADTCAISRYLLLPFMFKRRGSKFC